MKQLIKFLIMEQNKKSVFCHVKTAQAVSFKEKENGKASSINF